MRTMLLSAMLLVAATVAAAEELPEAFKEYLEWSEGLSEEELCASKAPGPFHHCFKKNREEYVKEVGPKHFEWRLRAPYMRCNTARLLTVCIN